MPVRRFDRGELRKPTKTGLGWLRVDAYLTRTGVFTYRKPDGTVRRELRLPEEVFHPDAMASFANVPVTDGHPSDALLDAANCRKFSVGAVGDAVRQDGEFVAGSMLLMDAKVIQALEAKAKSEVSCGYLCELEEIAGDWNGQRYDAIQRSIRGNHVAIVERGRAGPEVRIRLDEADAEQCDPSTPVDKGADVSTKKIRVDGVDFEGPEALVQAFEREQARAAESLKALGAEKEKLAARADAAVEQSKKLEASLKEATDPGKLRAAVATRVALETQARRVLGQEAKLDELDARAVKLAVLKKLTPEAKLDDKSDDYVQARFDLAVDAHDEENPGLDALRDAESRADADSTAGSPSRKVDTARAKMVQEQAAMWRKPLSASKQ